MGERCSSWDEALDMKKKKKTHTAQREKYIWQNTK